MAAVPDASGVPTTPMGSAVPTLAAPLGGTQDENNTIAVFDAAAPSTVFVTQQRLVVDYFAGRTAEVPSGSGSGFVWNQQGNVVTNFHVIQGAQSLMVTLQDGRSFDATVVGAEPRKDIAVLRIEAPRDALIPVQLPPEGTALRVGQKALAIGNPFGLDHTLTVGVVSALGREVDGIGGVTIRDMVQTDAAINPGNSGGPLLDSAGRLIGMNTMILSQSGASAGIGFAVPVSTIRKVVPQIISTGHAEQVGLGVRVDSRARLERQARVRGVAIISVEPGTPAERAGLRGIRQTRREVLLGDIIVGIGDEPVSDYDDLYNVLDRHAAGDVVQVKVLREGQPLQVGVELVRVDEGR